jgi:hypothetical protein
VQIDPALTFSALVNPVFSVRHIRDFHSVGTVLQAIPSNEILKSEQVEVLTLHFSGSHVGKFCNGPTDHGGSSESLSKARPDQGLRSGRFRLYGATYEFAIETAVSASLHRQISNLDVDRNTNADCC